MGNHSYAYAMGRVRAVERKMLSQNHFSRMIEAGTADDAFRILREAEYGGAELGPQFDARGYERLLEAENERVAAFVTEISPDPKLLGIFLLRSDYHNLKVLLKSEFSEMPAISTGGIPLSKSGVIKSERLARIVRERSFSELPAPMSAGIQGAIQAFNQSAAARSPDPQSIDVSLDRAMYAHMLGEADALGNPFIIQLIKINIDIANIGAFMRIKRMQKDEKFLRSTLVAGGAMEHGLFARHFRDGLDGFAGAARHTPYAELCEEGVKQCLATGTFTDFERRADDYVNAYIKKTKLLPFGLEIIAAYFIARQGEMKNVRIVMVGKINGIRHELIRERLRECFA